MTVAELKKHLEKLNDDALVVLAKDSEGNDYSPLFGYNVGWYSPDNSWSGDFTTHEDQKEEGDESALVLWPTN